MGNKNTCDYLIRLTPLEPYYFGSERTFGTANDSYFVRSNLFPQQTGLLGMIRKEILIQTNLFKPFYKYSGEEQDKMHGLIGKGSFEMFCDKSFGIIRKISPLYIAMGNTFYMITPRDHSVYSVQAGSKQKNKTYMPFSFKIDRTVRFYLGNGEQDSVFFGEYKAKDGLTSSFTDSEGNLLSVDDLFTRVERVGIQKNYEGGTEEKAFFKQVSYKMAKGYSFCFGLTLEKNEKLKKLKGSIVNLGGEKSAFKMDVEELDNERKPFSFTSIGQTVSKDFPPNIHKIVLLSDAYVEKNIYNNTLFALTDTVDFRNTSYKKDKDGKKRDVFCKSSVKFNFIKRGSVFLVQSNKTSDVENILNKKHLQKIGYNHFISLKGANNE